MLDIAGASAEVRYHCLRPAQAVERRKACPIAYVPLGTIEWHGPHNPLGADSIQAEELAIRCAQAGGLAFPPLYYGENRLECLMEANAAPRAGIAEQMELPEENFTPQRWLYSPMEQTRAYHDLLMHILNQMESLGFELCVLVAGHYPLVDHAAIAAIEYNKKRERVGKMLAWATVDYVHLMEKYPYAGDHAAGWETSHLLASCPELVDTSLLPPRGQMPVGVGGALPPQDATAELGARIYAEAAEAIVAQARARLADPAKYRRHGMAVR